MRRLVPIVLSLVMLAALAGPVAANPTGRGAVHVAAGEYDMVLAAGEGCADFAVSVEDISGRILEVVAGEDRHGNYRGKTMFHTVTRYTNLETGATITRPFDSIGHFVARPDGSLEIKALGDTLVWNPEPAALGLTPGIWLVENGHITLVYDSAGNVASATLHRGSTFDVCAALT